MAKEVMMLLVLLPPVGGAREREEQGEGVLLPRVHTHGVLISVTVCLMKHKAPTEPLCPEAGLIP